jgi:hypothetical protein
VCRPARASRTAWHCCRAATGCAISDWVAPASPPRRCARPEPSSAVEGLELALPERDECCGFGGLFAVDFPELSARIGRDRLRALAATGAEYVTATDSTCLLHLDGLRRREGFGPRPIHLAEVLTAGLA